MPFSDTTQASICGFDIGSENCYIGIARQGGIEIVLNDYSQRSTPAYVSLGDKQRDLGVSAKQKHFMNIANTFFALKRLVGRQFNEVASENLPFPIEQSDTGEVAVKVFLNDQEFFFTTTQLLAMLFTKLRQIAHHAVDCVINCPNYFTDAQRRALCDAALIAGLNPLRILSDMTAVGIYYCFYRLGSFDHSSIVAFVDVGHTNTQCAVTYFDGSKKTMQLLSVDYESSLGGKHFDELLANHFIQQHNLSINKRGKLRLEAECEKLKKHMSVNSNSLQVSVECLYDDHDFSSRIDRAEFESLAEQYLLSIEAVFKRALESAMTSFENFQKVNKDEKKLTEFKLTAVEVVGGASRIPAIKRIIREVFGLEASTTLNADEAIAQGCALQCAMLSPSFKVSKQLQVFDFAPYQINCKYWHVTESESKIYSINPLFNRGDMMPYTRQITVNCRTLPMLFEFEYVNANGSTTVIGQFQIDSKQKLQINNNKVKVKARLDNNGLISLVGATLVLEDKSNKNPIDEKGDENVSCQDQEESEKSIPKEEVNSSQENKDEGSNQVTKETEKKTEKEQAKSKTSLIELLIEVLWIRGKLGDKELAQAMEVEANLMLSDKNWKDRIDARNELEEYVYEWRDKLEEGRNDKFTTSNDKQSFMNDLKLTEQWLYEDEESGSTMSRSVYVEKLDALKNKYSNGINFRAKEFETRGEYLEKLGKAIQMGEKLAENENVDEAKVKKLLNLLAEKQKWFDECHNKFLSASLSADPPITTSSIKEQIDSLEFMTRSIYSDIQRKKLEKQKEEAKKMEEKSKKKENAKEEDHKKDHNKVKGDSNITEPMDVD